MGKREGDRLGWIRAPRPAPAGGPPGSRTGRPGRSSCHPRACAAATRSRRRAAPTPAEQRVKKAAFGSRSSPGIDTRAARAPHPPHLGSERGAAVVGVLCLEGRRTKERGGRVDRANVEIGPVRAGSRAKEPSRELPCAPASSTSRDSLSPTSGTLSLSRLMAFTYTGRVRPGRTAAKSSMNSSSPGPAVWIPQSAPLLISVQGAPARECWHRQASQ